MPLLGRPVLHGPDAAEDDVIETPLELLAPQLQRGHGGGQAAHPLLVNMSLFFETSVPLLQVDHGELQLLVDLHPTLVHVTERCCLLRQVLKQKAIRYLE